MDQSGAPWWLAGGAVALWLLRETWSALLSRRKERTETDVNIDLLSQVREGMTSMAERMRVMEEEQAKMRQRLDEEIQLRMKTQEEAHRLRMRVQTLESTLRHLGAVIPPEHEP